MIRIEPIQTVGGALKMNKIANVVYPYSPKNEDELELKVGDRIEVIGVEEEGWWKGTLKGRVGVFPSNFVQVVEAESTTSAGQNINKLNSIFGSRVSSKNSLTSSTSMNNINSSNNNLNIHNNNNSNINASNTSNSSTNLINNMNNTRQQHDIEPASPFGSQAGEESLHSTNSLSERRPKPLRGIGFGDIFAQGAKTKPLPADPITRSSTAAPSVGASANGPADASSFTSASNTLGRLSSSTLQKPIPKKPPPPTPIETNGAASADQAPALPPKPSNQFSPFLQQRPLPNPIATQRAMREQARVIYAYKPSNDDELEMEVDDIIDILDKNIEDAGWWKGELRGKVGVFPDNFVQLIGVQEVVTHQQQQQQQDATGKHHQNSSRLSGGASNSSSLNSGGGVGNANAAVGPSHQHQQQVSAGSMENQVGGKIKSVFAGTPKGFSKELESNLEKHSNPASFLSLKRNKLQQQMSSSLVGDQQPASMTANSGSDLHAGAGLPSVAATSSLIMSDMHRDQAQRQNGHSAPGHEPTSPGKLNHITANRAKGPTRRPPSNVLNKRSQLSELGNSHNKYEQAGHGAEESLAPAASLPQAQKHAPAVGTATNQAQSNQSSLVAQPNEQQQQQQQHHQHTAVAQMTTPQLSSFGPQGANDSATQQPILSSLKTNSPLSNGLSGENSQPSAPKTSQRVNQALIGQPTLDSKPKLNPTSAPSTPPWMVELRKTNAEKKRDPLPATTSSLMEDLGTSFNSFVPNDTPKTPTIATTIPSTPTPVTPATVAPAAAIAAAPTPGAIASGSVAANVTSSLKSSAPVSTKHTVPNELPPSKTNDSLKASPKSASSELSELRNDVRRLQEDFKSILGLKDVIETMKIELRTCQSATESQRKYIKELVNNLADERKRIAAMQTEIDRNLK